MSATSTVHVVCDGCGKRADVEKEYPNSPEVPAGWQLVSARWISGDFCSEACLRALSVADAVAWAARQFAKPEVPV